MKRLTEMKQKSNKHVVVLPGIKPGFTLIELLVVIAIISLLVSILLPSLTKAKELAQSAVCQSNLRSIGTGFVIYQSEWDGFYPSAREEEKLPNGSYNRWYNQINPEDLSYDPTDDCPSSEPDHCYVLNCWYPGGNVMYGFGNPDTHIDDISKKYPLYHWQDTEIQELKGGHYSLNYWVMVFDGKGGGRMQTYYSWRSVHLEGGNVLLADSSVEHWPVYVSYEDFDLFYTQGQRNMAYTYWIENYPEYWFRFRGPATPP